MNKLDKKLVTRFHGPDLKVFALGGLDEVGKNMYVLEAGDEIIIIDAGLLFPEGSYGVEYIIPDFTYLKENEEKIVGLFITHGHEDHIGGIPFLINEVNIPAIYASGLALDLIASKLNKRQLGRTKLINYGNDSVYSFKNFEVSFFIVNHSIPDAHGVAVKTAYGYVLHTGDFKFDLTPIGPHADFHKIARYGDAGVLMLLADSTNAEVETLSPSEREIAETIKTLMEQIKGRLIIATFASNVYRIQQVVESSIALGRKIVVLGRSMSKNLKIAQKLNYIDAPDSAFASPADFAALDPSRLTILATGSQGEPLAALSRIAEGTHRDIKIAPGDTIIFSSSAIPGNQESINRTINKLYRAGANVIINSPVTDTHTTGHASQKELQLMIALARPRYLLPIHGEFHMLTAHARLGAEMGLPRENCFCLENGEVLRFDGREMHATERVPAGKVYIDSNRVVVSSKLVEQRERLADSGVIALTFTVRDGKQATRPDFVSRGFIYLSDAETLIAEIVDFASNELDKLLARRLSEPEISEALETSIKEFIAESAGDAPLVALFIDFA